MNNYINITQLAKLRNTTTETLRHYDRIGLLKPGYVDPDNGYRYYSLDQVEIFDTIMDLRNMGMPLKDIDVFLKERNVEKSYQLLSKRQEELENEIREKTELLAQIKQKKEYIQNSKELDSQDTSKWVIKKIPERKIIVSGEKINSLNQFIYEYTKLRKNTSSDVSIFGTNFLGAIITKESFDDKNAERLEKYPVIPSKICVDTVIYGNEQILPAGEYLCCYGNGRLQTGNSMLPIVRKYIKDNKYEITGFILERDVIDMSLTGNEEELVFKLEIPVRKNKKI